MQKYQESHLQVDVSSNASSLTSPLKIAFIVGRFPVLSETFIINQITGLLARNHDVDIFPLEGPSGEDKMHPNVATYHLLKRVHYAPAIPENLLWRILQGAWLILSQGYKNPVAMAQSLNIFRYGKQAASLRLLYAAIPLLDKNSYDIVHCQFGIYAIQGQYPSDPGGLVLRELGLLKGKLVVSFRGWDISWFVKERGDRVYDSLWGHGDYFLSNCEFFRQRVLQLGCDPQKIVVHSSGIDCHQFTFISRSFPMDGPIRIATTGRLIEKKGIEYGIRAIALLARDYPNIEYNIIGDGYLRSSFEQLIQDLSLSHIIHLLGWRPQQEVIETLNETHIFIAPSVTAEGGNQDAPVNTLKEAMAMGIPVIATQHGGIPELVKDQISGFLVPERDAKAIAEKLRYLIEHPDIWTNLGYAGRKYVEQHYDMEQLNDELAKIYRQTLTQ